MMMKKIIIDLNGIIFEPIDASFKQTAVAEYGRVQGHMITMAYKYGLGRLLADKVENVLYKCASHPRVRPDAIEGLTKLSQIPDVSIEFCSPIAPAGHAQSLERQYREIAPCMDSVTHYELISPFKSKREYITKSTAKDKSTSNYVLDSRARYLQWPAKWRITPVLVSSDINEEFAAAHTACTARRFTTLKAFADYLQERRK